MEQPITDDAVLDLMFGKRASPYSVRPNVENDFIIESPLIAELLADARVKAKAESLLRVILKRYRELPPELAPSIRACRESAQLDGWLDVAGEAETLAQFRQQAGL